MTCFLLIYHSHVRIKTTRWPVHKCVVGVVLFVGVGVLKKQHAQHQKGDNTGITIAPKVAQSGPRDPRRVPHERVGIEPPSRTSLAPA